MSILLWQVPQEVESLFICPAKSDFFRWASKFLHAGCDFLHPEELAPHAKSDAHGYWCIQIWSRILHNWHFLENFVLLPKNNSSESCIKCIFAACKKLYAALQPAQIKLHPDENYLQHAKIRPPYFVGQINRAMGNLLDFFFSCEGNLPDI